MTVATAYSGYARREKQALSAIQPMANLISFAVAKIASNGRKFVPLELGMLIPKCSHID